MASSPEKDPIGNRDRVEKSHTLEEVAKAWKKSIADLKRRISERTVQWVQKGDRELSLQEEMKKMEDEPIGEPNSGPSAEEGRNGSTALTVITPDFGGKKEKETRENRAKEFFSDWLNGLKSVKWNGKLDEKVKDWIGQFFQIVERLRKKEVEEEVARQQVSLKLGLMTGRKEMSCDFCQVTDHFYPGALFADIYVDGELKWVMCPNCLWYCREQANGSLEKNVRARFNQLAHRLEQEARRARRLATLEDFRVPGLHEWEAWETASYALKEVASTYDTGFDTGAFDEGFDDAGGAFSDECRGTRS